MKQTIAIVLLFVAAPLWADEKVDPLLGKWVCKGEGNHPVIFGKDGEAQYGWEQVKDEWVMVKGTYSIDETGKITVKIKHNGASLSKWFRMKDGTLQAPRGPKPNVIWTKVEKK